MLRMSALDYHDTAAGPVLCMLCEQDNGGATVVSCLELASAAVHKCERTFDCVGADSEMAGNHPVSTASGHVKHGIYWHF